MPEQDPRKPKKQKFLQGAAILTIGAILVKVIGFLYKVPLNRIIGNEGFGHFNMAYSIFNVLLTISTAGLPIALSRMISEASTLGNRRQIQKTYQVGMRIFLLIGAVCSSAMLIFAPQLARFMRDPDAVYAIAALAPSVLFLCITSCFRGYFQGQQYMTPTAVSQIIEAVCKLVIGLGAVFVVLNVLHLGLPEAAGGAVLGVTTGSVLATIYLALVYRRHRVVLTPAEESLPVQSSAETARQLLRLAVPITIGSAGLQIFNALDSKIIQGQLQDSLGLTSKAATALFGTYSAAQTFYMLPPALIAPLAISIIPTVTAALTMSNFREARRTEESAVRMTALISLPCGAGLAVLASPIQEIIYNYGRDTLRIAGPILVLLGVAVVFNCMVSITTAILQAHGLVTVPIYTTLAGGLVNVITDYVLIGIPGIGIYGAAIATIAYCAVIMFLNIAAMHHALELPPRILQQFVKPAVATAVMSVGCYLSYEWSSHIIHGMDLPRIARALPLLIALVVAVVIYAILVYAMGMITWYDCQVLPKGTLIARILRVKAPAPGADQDS